jgi:hypothetical protein
MGKTSRWLDAEEDEEPKASSSKKKGTNTRTVLSKPAWSGKSIASRAQRLDGAVVEQVFIKALRGYPAQLKLRLVNLILGGGAENAILSRHREDLEDMQRALQEKVGEDKDSEFPAARTCVLAGYLGAQNLPAESTWLSDGAFVMEDVPTGVKASARAPLELAAIRSSPGFVDSKGAVHCYCGVSAVYKQQSGWNNQGKVCYFTCREGKCRMYVTVGALSLLTEMMEEMGVSTIPQFYCPEHPDKEIRISEFKQGESMLLQARCPWYSSDSGRREFCVKEVMGPEGDPHSVTGQQVWTAMDLLTSAK